MKDIDSWPKSTKPNWAYPPRPYAVQSCQEKESEQFHPKTVRSNGWFYKLALLDFELIFEVKLQESEGV